jgi:hypothetical protein
MNRKLIFSGIACLVFAGMYAQQNLDPGHAREGGYEAASATQAFYLPNKLVKPVLPALDKPHDVLTVNVQEGGVLNTTSGTQLVIPPKAFVDRCGNPIDGAVQIDYRQFSNAIDFIASGIPMTFDDKGKTETFESAGMFELTASQNGNEVFLKKGKNVRVDMVTTDGSQDYNFYQLDPEKGWQEKGKAAPANVDLNLEKAGVMRTEAKSESKAVSKFIYEMGRHIPRLPDDSTLLDARFDSADYFYTKKVKQTRDAWLPGKYTRWGEEKVNTLITLVRVKTPVKGEIAFEIHYKTKYHPELVAFNGKKWVVSDNETKAEFRQKTGYRNHFSDIRLSEEGDAYTLHLKGRNGMQEVTAKPLSNTELYAKERVERSHSREYKSYARALNRRRQHHDQAIAKSLERYHFWQKHSQEMAWNKAKSKMTREELAMNLKEWEAYCVKQQVDAYGTARGVASYQPLVARSLSVMSFGVFNCDRFAVRDEPVIVKAEFKDEQGQALQPTMVYVVDKSLNGFFSYPAKAEGPTSIQLARKSYNLILTVDANGHIAAVDANEVKDNVTSAGKTYVLNTKAVPEDPAAILTLLQR